MISGDNRSYSWNYENQPSSITGPDNVTETYTYDADNERLTRSRIGVTTSYLATLISQQEFDPWGKVRISVYQRGLEFECKGRM